ncbi:MAG: 3'-5' exoribonuclease YhaM family protein [Thermoguttaceae bacterium]
MPASDRTASTPRTTVQSMRENAAVCDVYRLTDKQLRPNKNGTLYLQCTLRDKTGAIGARLWNVADDVARSVNDGDYVLADGTVQRFQGSLQFVARKLKTVDPSTVDASEFVRGGNIDVPQLRERLQKLLLSLSSPALFNLANSFLLDESFMSRFVAAPAGTKIHHAYTGGLLEHTVTMMEAATRIAPLYPQLDAEILLMGTFVHDIGKIEELPTNGSGNYTDSGQLLGHAVLGIEILNQMIVASETLAGETFDPELALLLKHCIASHHGSYENQTVKLPMFSEAIVIHFLDSIDAKLAEFQRHIFEDPQADGKWTQFVPTISRKIYKRAAITPRE